MDKENKEIAKQLKELVELSTSIRNLLIMSVSKLDLPHDKIAKAAHMRKEKLYDYIPKQKKTTGDKTGE